MREQQIKEELMKENLKIKSNQKMIVGTGFSMDITDYFQFEKKKS